MNGEPLRLGDPTTLGAFAILSRLTEHATGSVLLGRDHEERQVAIVVLHAAAAADATVRDRFEAAVGALAQQGKVRDAAPRGPLAWAALAYDGVGVGDAIGLLDAAGPASGHPGGSPHHGEGGPAYAPHWSGEPAPGWGGQQWSGAPGHGTPAGQAAGPRSRTPILAGIVGAVVLLGIVIAACVVVIARSDADPSPGPTRPSRVAQPSTTPAAPTPAGSTPAQVRKDGSPGLVAGPTYAKGEDTYHMDLNGMPFEFDAPGTWGCLRGDRPPFSSRWVCVDEGGTFPAKGSGAGGLVAVQACAAPCGTAERRNVRKSIVVEETDWRKTDPTTMYAELTGTDKSGKRVVRVAMSHVFAANGSGALNTAVAVQLTGPPDQKATMQKLINEIRARTP
jgi:hypothetical protein